MMPLQRVRVAESRMRNKLANGPLRVQSNGCFPEYSATCGHTSPFMIVAGDHAKNDMAGDDPESWYSQFKSAGYEVEPVLKGLGEYSGIRKILVEHLSRLDVQ